MQEKLVASNLCPVCGREDYRCLFQERCDFCLMESAKESILNGEMMSLPDILFMKMLEDAFLQADGVVIRIDPFNYPVEDHPNYYRLEEVCYFEQKQAQRLSRHLERKQCLKQ